MAIRKYYRPAQETGHIVDYSDNLQYWPDGEPASEVIQEIAGVEPAVADAIDKYLRVSEWHDVRDGDDPFYGETLLEHVESYPDQFMEIWLQFEARLKHEVRFFDDEGKRLLDVLFADLPTLAQGRAIVTLEPEGEFSTLHRARIVDHDDDAEKFLRNPASEIGPPPRFLARAGRMNPVGISVFYGAFSEAVAIAEVRPPVGSRVVVGKFSLLRSVRLLDVSFLPFAYHNESVFSPAYDTLRNKVSFLERLHRRISRPVLPSDEALEYLPTQAVAAYVANVMGLDGMIYGSTQIGAELDRSEQPEREQCNIVLFGDAARVEGADIAPDVPSDSVLRLDTLPFELAPESQLPKIQQGTDFAERDNIAMEPEVQHPSSVVAAMRIHQQPRFSKITSVSVQSSPLFGHLNEDGSVIVHDYDDDDNDD